MNQNQLKGYQYEIQIRDYIINKLNKKAYLWSDCPETLLINSGIIGNHNENRIKRIEKKENSLIDTGIDIIQEENENLCTIIQCKNGYKKGLTMNDLAGFIYWMFSLEKQQINGIVYYTNKLSSNIKSLPFNSRIKYIKQEFIDNNISNNNILNRNNEIIPYDYQIEAFNKFSIYFKEENRGILTMPCGTGKTLTSYLISQDYKQIILISPLKQFARQNLDKFKEYGCILKSLLIDSDGTRDIDEIKKFINENNKSGFILSLTYCSVDMIEKCLDIFNEPLFIVDEFHNLSKTNIFNQDDSFYKLLNSNYKILFMSATPRVYELEDIEYSGKDNDDNDNDDNDEDNDNDDEDEDNDDNNEGNDDEDNDDNNEGNDNDDEDNDNDKDNNNDNDESNSTKDIDTIFGKIVYKMSFNEAIDKKYITDYRIWLPSIHEETEELDKELSIYQIDNVIKSKCKYLYSCLLNNGSKKCIIYCINTKEIDYMIKAMNDMNEFYCLDITIGKITSSNTHKSREEILKNFEESNNIQLLFSVRILDECIDIPKCDSIYITYPSESKIRTIQRICRCIRNDKTNKFKVGNIFIWCNEYDEILNTLSGIKEYDIFFNDKIKLNENNFYGKSNNDIILNDKKLINNYILGIKEFKQKTWDEKLDEVKKYIDINKKRPSSESKNKEIKRLGKWISHNITNYNKNKYIMKNCEIKNKWEEFIEEYSDYFLDNKKKWNEKLEEVIKYIDINKKRPSANNKDKEIKLLGAWIGTNIQNYNNNNKIMKNCEIKNKWKEFIEKYLDYFFDYQEIWYNNLEEVKKYINYNKKRPLNNDKNKEIKLLGTWISTNITNYNKNKYIMKNSEIKNKWEEFIEEYSDYFLDNKKKWNEKLEEVIKYIDTNKKILSANDKNKEIKLLGTWISHNIQNYNNNNKIMKNIEIKNKWEEFIEEYSDYFIDNEKKWKEKLEEVIIYIDINKKRPSNHDKNKEIKLLGTWISTNITNYKKNEYIMKNIEIKMKWEKFITDYSKYFK
jgi:superfamily II DNA or RNA helicase